MLGTNTNGSLFRPVVSASWKELHSERKQEPPVAVFDRLGLDIEKRKKKQKRIYKDPTDLRASHRKTQTSDAVVYRSSKLPKNLLKHDDFEQSSSESASLPSDNDDQVNQITDLDVGTGVMDHMKEGMKK